MILSQLLETFGRHKVWLEGALKSVEEVAAMQEDYEI